MKVQRRSPRTGKINEMELPVTEEQLRRHANGELAQTVFRNLTPEQREFIMTGYTPEDWKAIFPEEES